MSITKNKDRIGNFTSSEIWKLMTYAKDKTSFGAPALTYIEECNMERRLDRSLTTEINARPLTWGKFLEKRIFELLPMDYKLSSTETLVHPTIPFWSGSPDGNKFDDGTTVMDIKCPITLKSFCQLVDAYIEKGKTVHEALDIAAVRTGHKDGDAYYWQLVSNGILTGARYAELIVYVPYLSELPAIREMASNYDGNQNKLAFINFSEDDELPYLKDGGHYKNINIIRFEIPEEDKKALTDRVLEAGKMLNEIKAVAA